MPLAFNSLSHGTVAFGFFNIASDMLLLEQLFFFADRFCEAVVALAGEPGSKSVAAERVIDGWRIARRVDVGNLHGAIAGVDLSGFIGASYRNFPFPVHPDGFRQDPEGFRTQALMAELVAEHGVAEAIVARVERSGDHGVASGATVSIGGYRFSLAQARQLVGYVDRGGYPRWRDDRRPPYVTAMMRVAGPQAAWAFGREPG